MSDFTLFLNPRSPFARRIRLALDRLNLPFVEKDLGNVFEAQPNLWAMNPLGMVPTLITPENDIFSDSNNLLEYLHERTDRVWPEGKRRRAQIRQASVWCAGIMQSSILYFQEAKMHDSPSAHWLKDHEHSIDDTLKHLNELSPDTWYEYELFTQAAWDLCVALEYIDFRLPHLDWRAKYSTLSDLLKVARLDDFFNHTSPPQA